MKTRLLFVVALAVLLAGIGVVWLKAAPSVGPASAQPAYIVVNTSTPVVFTAQISDPALIPTSVNLLRTDASGRPASILGMMSDDGTGADTVPHDGLFTISTIINERQPGRTYFQVSAAFRGTLRRVVSPPFSVDVWNTSTDPTGSVTLSFPPTWSISTTATSLRIQNFEPASERDDLQSGEIFIELSLLTDLNNYPSRITNADQITLNGVPGLRGFRATNDISPLRGYDLYLLGPSASYVVAASYGGDEDRALQIINQIHSTIRIK